VSQSEGRAIVASEGEACPLNVNLTVPRQWHRVAPDDERIDSNRREVVKTCMDLACGLFEGGHGPSLMSAFGERVAARASDPTESSSFLASLSQ